MGTLGNLCIHMKVLKIEAALLVILYTMCGTAATPTTGKYLARFTVLDGEKTKGIGAGRKLTPCLLTPCGF